MNPRINCFTNGRSPVPVRMYDRLKNRGSIQEGMQSIEGSGAVETEEQLDSALEGLRAECERHIGAGKKVLIE